MLVMLWRSRDLGTRCVCDDQESRQQGHTQDTHRFFCRIALMHLKRKMINFWGRWSRTQETQSLNRPQEGFETYFTMTLCSLSAQMTPQDRQGTRNGKIPQHMHRLLVYQSEHQISAPSCNGDCKGGSSQFRGESVPFY